MNRCNNCQSSDLRHFDAVWKVCNKCGTVVFAPDPVSDAGDTDWTPAQGILFFLGVMFLTYVFCRVLGG